VAPSPRNGTNFLGRDFRRKKVRGTVLGGLGTAVTVCGRILGHQVGGGGNGMWKCSGESVA